MPTWRSALCSPSGKELRDAGPPCTGLPRCSRRIPGCGTRRHTSRSCAVRPTSLGWQSASTSRSACCCEETGTGPLRIDKPCMNFARCSASSTLGLRCRINTTPRRRHGQATGQKRWWGRPAQAASVVSRWRGCRAGRCVVPGAGTWRAAWLDRAREPGIQARSPRLAWPWSMVRGRASGRMAVPAGSLS